MTITVVVAEDEALVRAGCVMLLNAAPDIEVLGQAGNGAEAVELAHSLRPDVVLTWGPEGGYGHQDHRLVGDVVTQVFQFAGTQFAAVGGMLLDLTLLGLLGAEQDRLQ